MYLLIMVLDDVAHREQVLQAWVNAGVRGVTVLESTGINRVLQRTEAQPMYMGFGQLFGGGRVGHNTLFAVIETRQVGDRPAQAPLQPANVEPEDAVAVSVTVLFLTNAAEHWLPQLMPEGLLVSVPLPAPLLLTVRMAVVTTGSDRTRDDQREWPMQIAGRTSARTR